MVVIVTIYGCKHGFTNYVASFDRDKARITAVEQIQSGSRVYIKVDVEYLTSTSTSQYKQEVEKDTYYCYLEDEATIKKLKENQYKEVWIISGYKGGYETYKDFGNHYLKDIELIEEEN